jgi:hypothetical protein
MGAPVGNQNASKEWKLALRRAMAHKAEGDYRDTLLKIADGVVTAAMAGEKDAWREIAEREDGKVAQAIVGDSEADPIQQSIRVLFGRD